MNSRELGIARVDEDTAVGRSEIGHDARCQPEFDRAIGSWWSVAV